MTSSPMKLKQDNLYWEFNTETQKIDILWILETEDGRFYQKMKSINAFGGGSPPMPDRLPLESSRKAADAFK